MSEKTWSDLTQEWREGYDEAKADGGKTEYILATIGISIATLVAFALVIGLFVWVLDMVFWYAIGAVAYTVLAGVFGWPTPLDLVKKVFKK